MSAEPFSHSILAADIPPGGRHYRLEADEAERRALAESLDIPAVEALAAEIDVRPVAGQAFSIRGALSASVVQTDVVTLDPVTLPVSEEIEVTLMPAEGGGSSAKARAIFVDAAEAAGPDVYRRGRIDLGVIVAEHLALGLDPYPRAPETAFPGHVEDDARDDPSPFVALAALKPRDR